MSGTMVLVRHGQSEWNKLNLFTGWKDPGLTEQGVEEAKEGARATQLPGTASGVAADGAGLVMGRGVARRPVVCHPGAGASRNPGTMWVPDLRSSVSRRPASGMTGIRRLDLAATDGT